MPPDTANAASNADAIYTQLFLTAEGRANPYPLYHRLRRARPEHTRLRKLVTKSRRYPNLR